MPAIDPLLRALVKSRMESLVLRPDQTPKFATGAEEKPVEGTKLVDARTIHHLLSEVSPHGKVPDPRHRLLAETAPSDDLPQPMVKRRLEFDYLLADEKFRFAALATPEGWTLRVIHKTVAAPPPDPAALAHAEVAAGEAAGRLPIPPIPALLEEMIGRRASDLHLSSQQTPRMRIHGDLLELREYAPPSSDELQGRLYEMIPPRNREEFERRNDTDFAYEVVGRARFRVNVFRDRMGIGAVMRQIPHEIPTLDALGLPAVVRKLAYLSKGLVLVTGPTGSGKSTTLAAIINLVNEVRRDHILTIEDPIEFVHPSKKCLVHQREVGIHTDSFKQALRAALREDPDVVLVGEMRDLETISIAIETAETGHLVFGTLHTTTATSTVERVVDQFPGDRQEQIRLMLADSLKAVIAQTLLKKFGGGRIAAFEILITTPAVSNLIREGKTFQLPSVLQTGRQHGMIRMTDALFDLVQRKIVEPEEAYIKAVDKETLVAKLRAANIGIDLTRALAEED